MFENVDMLDEDAFAVEQDDFSFAKIMPKRKSMRKKNY